MFVISVPLYSYILKCSNLSSGLCNSKDIEWYLSNLLADYYLYLAWLTGRVLSSNLIIMDIKQVTSDLTCGHGSFYTFCQLMMDMNPRLIFDC